MSEEKGYHKIEIKSKSEGRLSTGANMEILLDGKPLKGVTSLKLEADARSMAKLTLTMYGEINADLIGELEKKNLKITIEENDE